jgi:hypothetical protein
LLPLNTGLIFLDLHRNSFQAIGHFLPWAPPREFIFVLADLRQPGDVVDVRTMFQEVRRESEIPLDRNFSSFWARMVPSDFFEWATNEFERTIPGKLGFS